MKQEDDFTKFLERITRYELREEKLDLYDEDRLILKFSAAKKDYSHKNQTPSGGDPDSQIIVKSGCGTALYNNRQKALKNPVSSNIELAKYKWVSGRGYLLFDKSANRISGHDGCNSYRGSYKTEGDKISITIIPLKRDKICVTAGGVSENLVKNANRFEIKDGMLRLFKDDRLLLTLEAQGKP